MTHRDDEPRNTLELNLADVLRETVERGGSDLHLAAGGPPRIRIGGKLIATQAPPLSANQTAHLCYSVMTERRRKTLEQSFEVDFSFAIRGLGRFRANIFRQRGCVGGAFRLIPEHVPTLESLGLPRSLEHLSERSHGLILVTGATGSGKSTTLAAMINHINSSAAKHIMTVEDPIEYVHTNKMAMINQREVGSDTLSFSNALRSCMRQDPDIILVGEMRDRETIHLALTAAETGHLVFATLHTNTAVSSITRMIDVFEAQQQAQVRTQLSLVLVAVISQLLVPSVQGHRVASLETLIPNPAVRNLIRENKIHQIYSAMQVGQEQSMMCTQNQSLAQLMSQRKITQQTAYAFSPDASELDELLTSNRMRRG